jgi:hypothetical protein
VDEKQKAAQQRFVAAARNYLGDLYVSPTNPGGCCVQYNPGENLPWQVSFGDTVNPEFFGSRVEALRACRQYADVAAADSAL